MIPKIGQRLVLTCEEKNSADFYRRRTWDKGQIFIVVCTGQHKELVGLQPIINGKPVPNKLGSRDCTWLYDRCASSFRLTQEIYLGGE